MYQLGGSSGPREETMEVGKEEGKEVEREEEREEVKQEKDRPYRETASMEALESHS